MEEESVHWVLYYSLKVVENAPVISFTTTCSAPRKSMVDAAPGYSSGKALAALEEWQQKLPAGYGYDFSGLSRRNLSFWKCEAILIFTTGNCTGPCFLAALYESWSLRFSFCWLCHWTFWSKLFSLACFFQIWNIILIYAQIVPDYTDRSSCKKTRPFLIVDLPKSVWMWYALIPRPTRKAVRFENFARLS